MAVCFKHYDLYNPSKASKSQAGCYNMWGDVCGTPVSNQQQSTSQVDDNKVQTARVERSIGGERYCHHGECYAESEPLVAKCVCDPGWGGERCNRKLEWFEFLTRDSYIEFQTEVEFPSQER